MISDYDGTLGGAPSNDIDEQTLLAINQFIDRGGKFVICSGRAFSSIRPICQKSGLKGLVVSYQGAMINDIQTGETLFEGGLDTDTACDVIKTFYNNNLQALAYLDDEFYYQENSPYVEYYENMIKLKGVQVKDLIDTVKSMNKNASKVCAMCENEIIDGLVAGFNQEYKGKGVSFNSGAKHLLEVINPTSDKGSAVRFLSKHYGIPLDKIITVGDSTNDKALVSGEWYGVAVGDGHEQLKAVAKEVTVPFKDKPVKYLIEKYCLND